jgi:recombination associated protein RdgC
MKTISVYKLENHKETIKQLLSDDVPFMTYRFRGCGVMDKEQRGFTENVVDGQYVSNVNGNVILTITLQKKKANPNLIKTLLDVSKLEYIETQRTVLNDPEAEVNIDKKTLSSLKQAAADEALAAAFPEEAKHFNLVFRPDGLLLVDGKNNAAEMLISLVRKALGSLKAIPYEPETPVTDLLDDWIKTDVSDKFTLGEKCELITAEGGKAVFSKEHVSESDAKEFLEEKGALTESLQVNYDGTITFSLKDDFTFNGLKYDECIVDDGEENSEGGNFILVLTEINKMVDEVISRLKPTEEK